MKRYEVQVIAQGTPEQNFRITDTIGDNRIGTCYYAEEAELICDALNNYCGKDKINPDSSTAIMNIRTEIASRIMANLYPQFEHTELCAEKSVEATDALIKELNK